MNSAIGYSEGAEVLEDKTPINPLARLRLEREYKWKRMDTLHRHNLNLLHENEILKSEIQKLQNEIELLKNKPI